jgi:Fe2+ transport system protein FeoA
VRGALVALRRRQARAIEVELAPDAAEGGSAP